VLLKLLQILRSFSKKERLIFIAAFLIFLTTFLLVSIAFIRFNTILVPVDSGEYTEGIIGQPIFLNPVLSENNTSDSEINRLVFASLKNIMETYVINSDKKTFMVRIKGDLKWQDNQPLTTDDIIFTIEAIQDQDTNSPLYQSWKGVKVERVSEREMKIVLPYQYAFFENILKSLKPIPKHIFSNIPFAHMKLSNYNLEPIGSGVFTFSGFSKQKDGFITSILLERNKQFSDTKSHLNKFTFKFYRTEDELIKAFNSGDIDGFALNDPKKLSSLYTPHQVSTILMSRYYAIFLNPSSNPLLKDSSIKTALNYATDKKTIADKVFNGYALPIEGPVLIGNNDWDMQHEFSIEKANQILDSAGWTLNSDGVREVKDKTSTKKLEFAITVYPAPFLIETVKILKDDWAKIGVKININTPSPSNFEENVIRTRNYDMLAFGNIYGENLDLFSFWHSSQKFYPGLNLSVYDNKNADLLMEIIRTDFDQNKRAEELKKLQSVIQNDQPAVFLYSPSYIYISTKALHGFTTDNIGLPSDRFLNINDWYVKTARILK